jgi:hypothetical protein
MSSNNPFFSILYEYIKKMGQSDPSFQLLADYMKNSNAQNSNAQSDPSFQLLADYMKNSNAQAQDDLQSLEAKLKKMEEKNARLFRAYKILIGRNEMCASALGMCAKCWGSDENCDCLGEGGPGSRIPDKSTFDILVSPALKTLGIITSNESKKLINNRQE